jgi:predicted RNase H-like HicB family nuclease
MATAMYTAIIEEEGDVYAALCPELDVASQGKTVEEAKTNLQEAKTNLQEAKTNLQEAKTNLQEAIQLFLECADAEEIKRRRRTEVFVTRIEATHG